jgi:hypothetical protein
MFFRHPISAIFLAGAVVFLIYFLYQGRTPPPKPGPRTD